MSTKKPKPILKKNRVEKPRTGLLWDELNIEETSKERGTRMKISEPDTPYNYEYIDPSSDEDEEGNPMPKPKQEEQKEESAISKNWDSINTKLEAAQKKQQHGLDLVSGDPVDEKKKREEFLQKRKTHYNEGQKWKEHRDQQKRTVEKKEKSKSEKQVEGEEENTGAIDSEASLEPDNKRQKT